MGGLVAPNWEIGCLGQTHWAVITVWGVSVCVVQAANGF